MRTMIFMIVIFVFAVITVLKRKSHEDTAKSGLSSLPVSGTNGYDDEKIGLFVYSFSKDKDISELGAVIEGQIEDTVSDLLQSYHVCRVEFMSVGYHLLVIIRAKLEPSKAIRKGRISRWLRQ